jgi:uncharacterized membrane protein
MNKKYELLQKPNLPLAVAFVAWVLTHLLPYGQLNFAAALIFFGALFTWAWMEIFDGANTFRRVLGIVVMAFIIINRL